MSQACQSNGSSPFSSIIKSGESEFRRLLDKLPAGAYTCDAQGLITYYNPRAAEMWGRAPRLNDPTDRFCGSFKLYAAADSSPIRHDQCWMALALFSNAEYNGQEILVERPSGERLKVLAHANPIRDDEGKLLGAVNVLVDITEIKRTEQLLREATRAKDEFLATLAHELRNPLAPVRNAIQILKLQAPATPEGRYAVDIINRQMEQMTRLIDDLLDISRLSNNKLQVRKEFVDLNLALRAAIETSRPLIESARQNLSVDLPPHPIYMQADATRLSQAFANILNNASKYTDPGGNIWLSSHREGSDAVITIRDDGIGIADDMRNNIFDMFTQVEHSIDRSQGGLGIGLSLVKRLVELHDGSISVHSDGLHAGSTFTIRLPLVLTSAPPINPASPAPTPAPSSLRIVIVDDNRDAANSLAMLLRITGNDVRVAHDGVAALDTINRFQPHVVLLDIGLPKINGYDVARSLRKQPWASSLTLIAVTGWGQESDKQESKSAGFDHHLVKPVDPAALLLLLATLEKERATPSPSTSA